MKTQFFPAVILTLCLTPSQEQTEPTGCQDINAFCGNWANRGLCDSRREFMQEQCPRTCSFCGVTQVLFPRPSIAKPDFICGVSAGTNTHPEVLNGSLFITQSRNMDSFDVSPSSESGHGQSSNDYSDIIPPIISTLLPVVTPATFFTFESQTERVDPNSSLLNVNLTLKLVKARHLQADSTEGSQSQAITIISTATAVGGGSDASIPSVGIVYPVQPSSSNPRPSAVKVIPRPTAVVGTFPTTRPPIVNPVQPRPVQVIPNPRPIQAITPTPVIQPVGVTSAVIPLIGPQGLEEAICGSVPITDRFLLSAAHCFHNQRLSRYRIRLGEVDISQTGEVNSLPQDVDIERIYIHPGYTHSSRVRYNDIALLKTIQKIRFSRLVFPLCILPKPIDVTGAPLTVAGFGLVNGTYRSPVLQAAELEGLNDARCQQRYRDLGHDLSLRDRYPDLLVGKGILCASAPGKSACQGDSGGPLTIRDQMGRQFVLGVVSIGASCLGNSLSTLPGLYTDVAFHVDWINEVIYGP